MNAPEDSTGASGRSPDEGKDDPTIVSGPTEALTAEEVVLRLQGAIATAYACLKHVLERLANDPLVL
jgi:hypothetical protein